MNGNGISDVWELVFLGEVPVSHPGTTDTDGDGLDDFGEFTAGSNPNDPDSVLALTKPMVLPNGDVELRWASVGGRSYRVQGSVDGEDWVLVSDWMDSTGGETSLTLPAPEDGEPFLFRVEVRP